MPSSLRVPLPGCKMMLPLPPRHLLGSLPHLSALPLEPPHPLLLPLHIITKMQIISTNCIVLDAQEHEIIPHEKRK
uniref:Uncharacterized protein n=1 Tax=Aegilops tauschii subsp. strangulata TaxID=200361 RepID=A0A453LYZ5_AEGTS